MRQYNYLMYALACVLIWSFIPIVSRLGQAGMDSFQFLFWSNLISAISVVIVALGSDYKVSKLFILPRNTIKKVFILGFLDCLFYLLLYYGYSIENGIAVLVIQYSWPLIIILLSVVLLKDKLAGRQIVGIIIGFIAVIITFTKGQITQLHVENPTALLLVFSGAFCFALMSVFSRQYSIDPYISTVWLFIFSTLTSLVLLLLFSEVQLPSKAAFWPTLINGILINGVSYILWFKAMNTGHSAKIASVVFLSPVLSVLWLVLILSDPFEIAYIIGVLLVIISGVLCVGIKGKVRNRE
ncbi:MULTISPECIES: DMT family transporter [Providencia]|uniref:Threonine/homoserine exporter RhtA n=1 Tax=Providencia huashanensis TaxID=3037798 RepID=A0AA42K014_9GAMM|nr:MULTISPECIES: DMT family transporter [unclassified Providencia]EJD6409878.1 DMT family transporter [Providencia rettgeri]NIL72665.1 DMT family transporter [Providencia sp. 504mA]EJD6500772.1 DMT family transporter [Providencia rettgeri]EJD6581841.1 DMT family transporter [Providencia rettgeri]EJD6642190.1 DMT family transporter [Providencia rettgeri]